MADFRLMVLACDLGLVSIGMLYLTFSYAVAEYGLTYVPTCPFYLITSIPCPFCGMTRSIGELLHGHVDRALSYHPSAMMLMILWIAFITFFGFSLMHDIRCFLRQSDRRHDTLHATDERIRQNLYRGQRGDLRAYELSQIKGFERRDGDEV